MIVIRLLGSVLKLILKFRWFLVILILIGAGLRNNVAGVGTFVNDLTDQRLPGLIQPKTELVEQPTPGQTAPTRNDAQTAVQKVRAAGEIADAGVAAVEEVSDLGVGLVRVGIVKPLQALYDISPILALLAGTGLFLFFWNRAPFKNSRLRAAVNRYNNFWGWTTLVMSLVVLPEVAVRANLLDTLIVPTLHGENFGASAANSMDLLVSALKSSILPAILILGFLLGVLPRLLKVGDFSIANWFIVRGNVLNKVAWFTVALILLGAISPSLTQALPGRLPWLNIGSHLAWASGQVDALTRIVTGNPTGSMALTTVIIFLIKLTSTKWLAATRKGRSGEDSDQLEERGTALVQERPRQRRT